MNPVANRLAVICNCRGLGFANYEHAMCLICLEILSEQYSPAPNTTSPPPFPVLSGHVSSLPPY